MNDWGRGHYNRPLCFGSNAMKLLQGNLQSPPALILLLVVLLAGCATSAGGPENAADVSSAPSGAAAAETMPPANVAAPAERREPLPPARGEGNAVFFLRGSAVLDDAALAVLRVHAERLRDAPQLVVTLIGHADDLGSRSFSLAVAEQRTVAVKGKLRELGVPAKQIRQRSYGSEKAAAACRNDECRKRTRRVDLVYPTPRKAGRVGR